MSERDSMSDEHVADLLDERLIAVAETQTRARIALFVTVVACCTILAVLWNAYLSWDAQWSGLNPTDPKHWGQRVLVEQRIKTWQQSYDVDIGLLGIHLAAADAAYLGSLVLLA